MKVSWIRWPLVCSTILCGVVWVGEPPHEYREMCCFAQEPAAKTINGELARALNAIRRDREGILEGFQILRNMDLGNSCPDQLLALIHVEGKGAQETIWRLGMLIVEHKLTISGKQLAAEYDKAPGGREITLAGRSYGLDFDPAGSRARRVVCAFAAYQTHRKPPEHLFGRKAALPKPKPLDEEALALLARALTEGDPAVRVAAADSIRLTGIGDDRFLEPLLKGITDENTVVSKAASLAAAELGFERAGPLILRRLERHLEDPKGDSEGDLAACGLGLAPLDYMHLLGDYYSPCYGRGGWIVALGMLHHRPALPLLRKMAAPHKRTGEEMGYLTGGESEAGWEDDLAKAILDIGNRPHRPAALLQLAEDKTLAGNVRAAALWMLDECDSVWETRDPATGTPILTDLWRQYYEPGILRGIVKLIDEQAPITDRANNPSRFGRLAVEIAANKFDPHSTYYQARLESMGKPSIYDAFVSHDKPPPVDPVIVYPEDVLPIRRQFQEKLESLLPGRDGALALEALAVACPEWGSCEKYVEIATDPKRQPTVRVAAANLLTWQPLSLEMDGDGISYGMNAPPETASKLLSLLEIWEELPHWRHQVTVTGVFHDLLGYSEGDLTAKQRAARKEVLPKLRAMRNSPHADVALSILLDVYGFSRAATAWDPTSDAPFNRPRQPVETGADAHAGPPVEVTARRCLDLGNIRFFTLAQNGKTLLVGDGTTLRASGSSILLLDPRDLSERARTSISNDIPWSSDSAVLGRNEQHVLVFNRFVELNTLKTVSVLDVKKAVTEGNVWPNPLAISPSGKLALVHVSSYLSSKLNALAIFDLASGSLVSVIDVDEEQKPVSNACFLDEKEIAVQGCRGYVQAVNLENGKRRDLCDDGPRTISHHPGKNWYMAVLAEGRYLVVSGYHEFVVIETSQGKEVFRKTGIEFGNAVPILGDRFLLYQATVRAPWPVEFFFCVRVKDGKVVAKFARPGHYDTLMPGEQDDIIYGVYADSVSRLRFQWGKLRENDELH